MMFNIRCCISEITGGTNNASNYKKSKYIFFPAVAVQRVVYFTQLEVCKARIVFCSNRLSYWFKSDFRNERECYKSALINLVLSSSAAGVMS
jgi:hypothetical protein